MGKVYTLLAFTLQVLSACSSASTGSSGFFYQNILNGDRNGSVYFSAIKLHVEAEPRSVSAVRGSNITLPCWFWFEPQLNSPRGVRVRWYLSPLNGNKKTLVLDSTENRQRSFGAFKGRVHLKKEDKEDVSLIISNVDLTDSGQYHCEVIYGVEDESATVDLGFKGVVFPYQSRHGRYHLTFPLAHKACNEQDAIVATFDQLSVAWKEGLNCCNAGWVTDGTVLYPIINPRQPCGGLDLAPGVRSYGARHKHKNRYDVFCFTSKSIGEVYFLKHPQKLNFTMAKQACIEDGAQIAKVGQLYAAWKDSGLDQCDAGWMADESLRYPINKPRKKCGPQKKGVHSFGFPRLHSKHGVYCYKLS